MSGLDQTGAPDSVVRKSVLASVVQNTVIAHLHRKRLSKTDGVVADDNCLMHVGNRVSGNCGVVEGINRVGPNILGRLFDVGNVRGFDETHIFNAPNFAREELIRSAVVRSVDPRRIGAEITSLVRIDEANVCVAVDLRSLVRGKQLRRVTNQVDVEEVRSGDTGTANPRVRVQHIGSGQERVTKQTVTILGVVLAEKRSAVFQGLNRGRTKQHLANLNSFDVLSNGDRNQTGAHGLSFHSSGFCDIRLAGKRSIPEELDGVTGDGGKVGVDFADSLKTQHRLRAEKNVLRIDVQDDVVELDAIS